MKNNRTRNLVAFAFIGVLGIGALVLAWQINRQAQLAPEETQAAADQVWNAEIFHEDNIDDYYPGQSLTAALAVWANGWAQIDADPELTFEKAKAFANAEGARFIPDREIMTVGEEVLYGSDLNYMMFMYNYPAFTREGNLTDEELNEVLDIILEQSLVLQAAKREGYVQELSPDVFNNVSKNFTVRNALVNENLQLVEDLLVQNITFEIIKLYYDNVGTDPDNFDASEFVSTRSANISKEDAKLTVQRKMDNYYKKLLLGEITMDELRAVISADTSQEDIDWAYETNAYEQYTAVPKGENPFASQDDDDGDQVLYDELWALGDGQYSQIIQDEDDRSFAIIRVLNRQGDLDSVSYESLIEDEKNKTNLDISITK